MGRDRESRISATKPIFPEFLLPSLRFPFSRRQSESGSSRSDTVSTAATSPSTSPIEKQTEYRLARTNSDTLRCNTCSSDIAMSSQVISKGFTGRYGRALLVAPLATPGEQSLMNVRVGHSENRQLVTGWHVVADIWCGTCSKKLGWKYVDAKESSQHYKIGKFILETRRVISHRNWEDVPTTTAEDDLIFDQVRKDAEVNDIAFDSEDEDECEDLFAGVWDANAVAKRRSQCTTRLPAEVEWF